MPLILYYTFKNVLYNITEILLRYVVFKLILQTYVDEKIEFGYAKYDF